MNNNRDNRNDVDVEIDLLQIGRVVLAKIWVVILSAIATGIIALLATQMLITPMYQSTSKLYIINRQNDNTTTYTDLQSATQLVKDYKVLVTSLPVMEQVIKDLQLNMSEDALISEVSCKIESDSRVLALTVTDKDPYMAKKIVDAIADVSSKQITSVMKIEGVNVIEYGRIPSGQSSPNVKKNVLMGVALGLFISLAVIIIRYLLNDSIKSTEDVEKYLGMSTLALIPITKEEYDGKSSKKNKRGSGRRK
ncbi:MAG: Wzz/FepE/Etk N-terminal domain-containing protein [Eubacteriales bacterium]|nr:Wzz/FepE/Etk N-terminal domain-containing protein [Eubacteriales bacterium]